jgi:hypothetical protein
MSVSLIVLLVVKRIMGVTGAWMRGEMERCSWGLWQDWGCGELGDGCRGWLRCLGCVRWLVMESDRDFFKAAKWLRLVKTLANRFSFHRNHPRERRTAKKAKIQRTERKSPRKRKKRRKKSWRTKRRSSKRVSSYMWRP